MRITFFVQRTKKCTKTAAEVEQCKQNTLTSQGYAANAVDCGAGHYDWAVNNKTCTSGPNEGLSGYPHEMEFDHCDSQVTVQNMQGACLSQSVIDNRNQGNKDKLKNDGTGTSVGEVTCNATDRVCK